MHHDHEHGHVHDEHDLDCEYEECHHHHDHHLDHHHDHLHEHGHTHEGEVDSDPDEYERHAAHADALERLRLERHAERLRHAHRDAERHERAERQLEQNAYAAAMSVAERVAFEKHNLAQAQAQAAQAQANALPGSEDRDDRGGATDGTKGGEPGRRKRLVDDPERMDEAVRELFNWIKAVVWTIEQAAIVAGRRGWAAETK